jgi:hypothetical protein
MKWLIGISVAASIVLATGCREFSPPIHLAGRPSDVSALVGDWHGDYVAFGSPSRHGTISFVLEPGDETARGSVVMIPEGSHHPYERYRGDLPVIAGQTYSPLSEVLSITVVRIEENMVRGEMDPYWDPDRECVAFTHFYGFIDGRTIEGTFRTTYNAPFGETTGRWRVTRSANAPARFTR